MSKLAWFGLGFVSYAVFMPIILAVLPDSVGRTYVEMYVHYVNAVADTMLSLFFGVGS